MLDLHGLAFLSRPCEGGVRGGGPAQPVSRLSDTLCFEGALSESFQHPIRVMMRFVPASKAPSLFDILSTNVF